MKLISYKINCSLSTETKAEALFWFLNKNFGLITKEIKKLTRNKNAVSFEIKLTKEGKEIIDTMLRYIVSNLELPMLEEIFETNKKKYDFFIENLKKNQEFLTFFASSSIKEIIENGLVNLENFTDHKSNNTNYKTCSDLFYITYRRIIVQTDTETLPIFVLRNSNILQNLNMLPITTISNVFINLLGNFFPFEKMPTTYKEYLLAIDPLDLIEYKELCEIVTFYE
jgi:hypothetical protein